MVSCSGAPPPTPFRSSIPSRSNSGGATLPVRSVGCLSGRLPHDIEERGGKEEWWGLRKAEKKLRKNVSEKKLKKICAQKTFHTTTKQMGAPETNSPLRRAGEGGAGGAPVGSLPRGPRRGLWAIVKETDLVGQHWFTLNFRLCSTIGMNWSRKLGARPPPPPPEIPLESKSKWGRTS